MRREHREDGEQVRRVADVDGLCDEIPAAGPDPIPVDIDAGAEGTQDLHDAAIPPGAIGSQAGDRDVASGQRRGGERERCRREVAGHVDIHRHVSLPAGDAVGLAVRD